MRLKHLDNFLHYFDRSEICEVGITMIGYVPKEEYRACCAPAPGKVQDIVRIICVPDENYAVIVCDDYVQAIKYDDDITLAINWEIKEC